MTTTPFLPKPHEFRATIVRGAVDKLYRAKGIYMSDKEYDVLAQGIRVGFYKQVATDFRGQPVYQTEFRGQTLFVVWSCEYDCVRTFLGKKAVVDHLGRTRPTANWNRKVAAAAAFKPASGGATLAEKPKSEPEQGGAR